VATDSDAAEWDAFVSDRPRATGYHAWAWRRVFSRAFGHESIYLTARRNRRIVGILPLVHIDSLLFGKTLTSLPFLNYGGIVADDETSAQRLLDAAVEIARSRRCRHVELRHVECQFPDLPCRQHKVAMLLKLEPGMWERLDRKVRNQIRKAQKSDLTVEQGGSELLDDFYTVFARNMRDLGTPVYGRRLFQEVLDTFPDRAVLHVVRLHGRPIGAGFAYRTGTTTEVPWASSIRDFNSLCVNHLLYWHVIEHAVENGCTRLDFGRSTPNEGTYKFKSQWGAQPVPLHWEYRLAAGETLPNVSPANPKFHLAIEFWKPAGFYLEFHQSRIVGRSPEISRFQCNHPSPSAISSFAS
jgi:FemAB-related protein (PEP-CTERM system-associated)